MKLFNYKRLGQSGQVAVEYVLMLLVIVTIITTLAKRFNEEFLSDDGQCLDPQSTALVCQTKKLFSNDFQFFTLIGAKNSN